METSPKLLVVCGCLSCSWQPHLHHLQVRCPSTLAVKFGGESPALIKLGISLKVWRGNGKWSDPRSPRLSMNIHINHKYLLIHIDPKVEAVGPWFSESMLRSRQVRRDGYQERYQERRQVSQGNDRSKGCCVKETYTTYTNYITISYSIWS